jgi:DNA-binding GntR family transcriptional regulator
LGYLVYRMQVTDFRRPNQVREAVYGHLKALLLSGRFAPGERLSELLLAKELGVSRTPVREALMRLAEEGLLELVPGKGARVRAFTPEEVEEVYRVRALLEGEAAKEAALRARPWELLELEELLRAIDEAPEEDYPEQMRRDLEFHRALVRLSGNRTLLRLYEDLLATLALARSAVPMLSQDEATRREHWAILKALKARDSEGAKRAVEAHIYRFRDLVVRRLLEGV